MIETEEREIQKTFHNSVYTYYFMHFKNQYIYQMQQQYIILMCYQEVITINFVPCHSNALSKITWICSYILLFLIYNLISGRLFTPQFEFNWVGSQISITCRVTSLPTLCYVSHCLCYFTQLNYICNWEMTIKCTGSI